MYLLTKELYVLNFLRVQFPVTPRCRRCKLLLLQQDMGVKVLFLQMWKAVVMSFQVWEAGAVLSVR